MALLPLLVQNGCKKIQNLLLHNIQRKFAEEIGWKIYLTHSVSFRVGRNYYYFGNSQVSAVFNRLMHSCERATQSMDGCDTIAYLVKFAHITNSLAAEDSSWLFCMTA